MNGDASQKSRAVPVLGCLLALSLVALVWLSVQHAMQCLRIAWAEDQVRIARDLTEKALKSDRDEALALHEYVRTYYPSGTKQIEGSRLDFIVESYREKCLAQIARHHGLDTDGDADEGQ